MPIRTHCAAGDILSQAGLIVELNKQYGPLAVPYYEKYEALVKSLFHAYPEISFYMLPHKPDWGWGQPPDDAYDRAQADNSLNKAQEIRLGAYFEESPGANAYVQAGIDPVKRWESSPTAKAAERVFPQIEWPTTGNRIFYHDDPGRRRAITKLVSHGAFHPYDVPNMLQYANILKTADEIHVIDSAFFWLALSLPVKSARLFLHHYAWPWPRKPFRDDDTGTQVWEVLRNDNDRDQFTGNLARN